MAEQKDPAKATPTSIEWNESNSETSYSNVCNVTGTREEVTLLFGIGKPTQGESVLRVDLSNRVILSPYAAKRLSVLLGNVVSTYEQRFGSLDVEQPPPLTTTRN